MTSRSEGVTSIREWLRERRDWDRLRALRTTGRGYVEQYPVAVSESHEKPGQLRIERGYDD